MSLLLLGPRARGHRRPQSPQVSCNNRILFTLPTGATKGPEATARVPSVPRGPWPTQPRRGVGGGFSGAVALPGRQALCTQLDFPRGSGRASAEGSRPWPLARLGPAASYCSSPENTFFQMPPWLIFKGTHKLFSSRSSYN